MGAPRLPQGAGENREDGENPSRGRRCNRPGPRTQSHCREVGRRSGVRHEPRARRPARRAAVPMLRPRASGRAARRPSATGHAPGSDRASSFARPGRKVRAHVHVRSILRASPRLHPHRIAGGDRHHRHPHRPAAAGGAGGARGGAAGAMPGQPPPDRDGGPPVFRPLGRAILPPSPLPGGCGLAGGRGRLVRPDLLGGQDHAVREPRLRRRVDRAGGASRSSRRRSTDARPTPPRVRPSPTPTRRSPGSRIGRAT